MEPDEPTDAVLVARAREGDHDAWSQLARRHAPRLAAYLGARLARPAVVDRLVADAVVAAWRKLPDLDDPASFAAWSRRIAASLAMRWRADHPEEKLKEPFPAERCADPGQAERMRRLQAAIASLPSEMRMALEQRYRAGLAGGALAEALHADAIAADAQVDRALAALDRALGPGPA